ncbi:mfs monocarboxylate [Moniliophthora roreri MCA 2997]|uniref:Mfs monocarboxylate n=3 Tax=Moniliophthora roreri TaxID=221103 RepID=V2WTQ3_MONRO|nr:mfs monocarboxylate [Moniliophthora roreri MCA 2997]KAI3609818.1 mfs monocarboxylate [Moniliophthora roreri]
MPDMLLPPGVEDRLSLTSQVDLSRTVSRQSAVPKASPSSSSINHTSANEGADGGYGWVCVLCSFVVHFFALGIESSWGVYQNFYFTSPDEGVGPISNSNLAWVGSIQATGQPLVGYLAAIMIRKVGYRWTGFFGTVIMAVSLITASFSTHTWHLYLTQGILFGIGSGFAYIPAVTIPSLWFTKHRGLAMGISASGYGIGGLVLSPVTEKLISTLGFRWALRVTGISVFAVLSVADVFMKPRATQIHSTKIDRGLMKTWLFASLCSIGLLSGPGFYVPIFYLPSYVRNKLGRSAQDGATAAALIAGSSAVGRIVMGHVGDLIGPAYGVALCQGISGLSQLALWPFINNFAGSLGFATLYGFFSGGWVSLYPTLAASIYGAERLATVTGVMFSSYIPGTLAGPPLAGWILDKYTSADGKMNFLPVQLYGGSWLVGAACMALVVRLLAVQRSATDVEDSDSRRAIRPETDS